MSTSISFPPNPTSGNTYTYGSITYVFNGKQWVNNTNVNSMIYARLNVDSLNSYIDADVNNNLTFTDINTGTKTLAQLASGSGGTQYTLSADTITNIDFNLSDNFYIFLDKNITFTVSNVVTNIGKEGRIIMKQDTGGGKTFVEANEFKTPIGGATIVQTTTANSTSILSYYIIAADFIIINYIGDFA